MSSLHRPPEQRTPVTRKSGETVFSTHQKFSHASYHANKHSKTTTPWESINKVSFHSVDKSHYEKRNGAGANPSLKMKKMAANMNDRAAVPFIATTSNQQDFIVDAE